MKILVTGASGFVGSAVVEQLTQVEKVEVCMASRHAELEVPENAELVVVRDLQANTDWSEALAGVDAVVHTAGIAHSMLSGERALAKYRSVNVEGTLKLASQAAQFGVRRFVFISSIKVNGESTDGVVLFTPEDVSTTHDPYGVSKREAEKGLLKLAKQTGMEVVIIRPPLVYGPGVKANFRSLLQLMNLGIPLPFGATENKRSFLALDNLVSFIIVCVSHPKAANEIFLVSDGEDISTTELLKRIKASLGKTAKLIPVPVSLMIFLSAFMGKSKAAKRFFSSLCVDSSKARILLGWQPVVTMDEQLKKTAEAYQNEKNI